MRTRMVSRVVPAALVLSLGLMFTGCTQNKAADAKGRSGGMDSAADAMPNRVVMSRRAFTPATLTVPAGTTVTWINREDVSHTVTSDDKKFDSGQISPGQTFSFTFTDAGTYAYHCNYHGAMTGQVVVK